MSVTVRAASSAITGYTTECAETGETWSAATRDEVALATLDHEINCDLCVDYGMVVMPVMDTSDGVNMANGNAAVVFSRLGLTLAQDGDVYGEIDADVFTGAVLTALASDIPDDGTADVRDGNWIYCGVEAGYYTRVLTALLAVGEEARAMGRPVTWS